MIEILKELERTDLKSLLDNPDIWTGIDIDYHPPRVERIWTTWKDYRVLLHIIHPCESGEALYHSHPWPSAVKIVSGLYETGVGFKQENGEIKTCAKFIIDANKGINSYYEMLDKEGFHYVRPLDKVTFSIMITGKPWETETAPKPTKVLEKITPEKIDFIRRSFQTKINIPNLEYMYDDEQNTIYVDMDDTICDFVGRKDEQIVKNPLIQYPQSQYGFFTGLEPIPGAIETINFLQKELRYDVWILTRPSVHNPLCYTEKRVWIEKHFGIEMCHKLYIAPDKDRVIGAYLIDDQPWERFRGKQLLYGSPECKDWEAVKEYFLKMRRKKSS